MLTETQKNEVFALAVLATARKLKSVSETNTEQKIINMVEGLKAETKNILIEHLTADQIAELAANDLASGIAKTLKEFFIASLTIKGELDLEKLIQGMVEYCSLKLGREVEL